MAMNGKILYSWWSRQSVSLFCRGATTQTHITQRKRCRLFHTPLHFHILHGFILEDFSQSTVNPRGWSMQVGRLDGVQEDSAETACTAAGTRTLTYYLQSAVARSRTHRSHWQPNHTQLLQMKSTAGIGSLKMLYSHRAMWIHLIVVDLNHLIFGK